MTGLDFLGLTGTVAGLYDFVSAKLKDDTETFKKQLRKNITVICDAVTKKLSESHELADIIPSDTDKVIYNEIISALEQQRQMNIETIKKSLGIPRDDIFDLLIEPVRIKLRKSFMHCQWDYINWSRQTTNEIKKTINEIKETVNKTNETVNEIKDIAVQLLEAGGNAAKTPPPKDNTRPDITSLPFARNNYFTGREKTLEDISKNLENGNTTSLTQTITGMGGFGKTQTALEYVYRCYHDDPCKYNYIHWVHAETEMEIAKSYRQLAAKMGLPITEQHDNDAVFDTVTNWMNNNDKWLFVYDNADNIPDKVKWLPKAPRGHILITTRDRLCQVGEKVDISVFTEDEAVDFLEKRTKKEQPQEALALAKRLGCFPLALEQAAAYMVTNKNVAYDDYVKLLDKYGLELLEDMDGVINYKYDRPVAVTLKISIDKIKNEAALQLLYLCAYIAPEDIWTALFTETHDMLPQSLGEAMQSEVKRNKVWTQLTKYSLLEEQEDGSYTMHRLLQEIVRDEIKNDPQWALTWLGLFVKIYDFKYGNINSHQLFLYLSPHVQAFTNNVAEILADDESQEKIAYLYNTGGFGYQNLGYYNQALEWYQKALVISEKVLGTDHPDTAVTYNNIATIYKNQGDYTNALEWHQKALIIKEKVLGIEHPDTATTYNNIAIVYKEQGEYTQALEWYQKALVIVENILGIEHPYTATTYNNIAIVYRKQGDYTQALEWYQKALAIYEKVFGIEHPHTANTYNNIASVYNTQGDYTKALEWHQKALVIHEKVLGIEHPDTANTYNNIAYMYDDQGDYPTALEWFQKALVSDVKRLGIEHPYTQNTLAAILRIQNLLQ